MNFKNYTGILFLLSAVMACSTGGSEPDEPTELARLNEAIRKEPGAPTLLKARGQWYSANEQPEKAIADWEKVLLLDSSKAEHYHLLAEAYLLNEQPSEAVAILSRARAVFPDTLQTGLKLAYYLHLSGNFQSSLISLRELGVDFPDNPDVFFLRGINHMALEDTLRAIRAFEAAVLIDPLIQEGEGLFLLAGLRAGRQDDRALVDFNLLLRLIPDYWEAYLGMASFYQAQGKSAKALEVYRELILRNPQSPSAYLNSGLLYLEADSLSKARQQFDLAIQTEPTMAEAYYYRALTAELLGEMKAASRYYRQVLQLDPESAAALAALERLEVQN